MAGANLYGQGVTVFFHANSHRVRRATFFFRYAEEVSYRSAKGRVFFRPSRGCILGFRSFDQVRNRRNCLFPIVHFVEILVNGRNGLQGGVNRKGIQIAFFLPRDAGIVRPIRRLLSVFFPTRIFEQHVLASVVSSAKLASGVYSCFMYVLVHLANGGALGRFARALRFHVHPFVSVRPVAR